ncbi:MAG: hypothetical protein GY822_23280 [Deltaproteobacteria bacterium]|nr:hypothetical protein [Deltaproteobacteria bacterium]
MTDPSELTKEQFAEMRRELEEARKDWAEERGIDLSTKPTLDDFLTDGVFNEFLLDFGELEDGTYDRFNNEVGDLRSLREELREASGAPQGGEQGLDARDDQIRILHVLRTAENPLTRAELTRRLKQLEDGKISKNTLRRRLKELIALGFIRGRGNQNGSSFYVAGGAKPQPDG